jgi:Zn-dependent membrane protease YugP
MIKGRKISVRPTVTNLFSESHKSNFFWIMTSEIRIVFQLFLGISLPVSAILKSKFFRYGKSVFDRGLFVRLIAKKMFRESRIYDVKVTSVDGFLSDHYKPATKLKA